MRTSIGVVLSVLALCAAVAAMTDAMSLPEIHVSHSSGKCVRMVDASGEHPCPEQLPSSYEHVWVK